MAVRFALDVNALLPRFPCFSFSDLAERSPNVPLFTCVSDEALTLSWEPPACPAPDEAVHVTEVDLWA